MSTQRLLRLWAGTLHAACFFAWTIISSTPAFAQEAPQPARNFDDWGFAVTRSEPQRRLPVVRQTADYAPLTNDIGAPIGRPSYSLGFGGGQYAGYGSQYAGSMKQSRFLPYTATSSIDIDVVSGQTIGDDLYALTLLLGISGAELRTALQADSLLNLMRFRLAQTDIPQLASALGLSNAQVDNSLVNGTLNQVLQSQLVQRIEQGQFDPSTLTNEQRSFTNYYADQVMAQEAAQREANLARVGGK